MQITLGRRRMIYTYGVREADPNGHLVCFVPIFEENLNLVAVDDNKIAALILAVVA